VKMWRELQKKEVPRALTKEEQVGLLLETWRTIPDCGSVLLGEFDSSLNLRLRLNEIIAIKKMVPVPDESEECNWVRAVYDNGQNGILYGPAEAWRLPVIRFIEFLSTEGMRGPFVIVAHFSSLKLWSAVLHRCAPAVDVVTFAGGLAALSAAKQALEGLLQEMSRDRRGAKPIVMLVSLASAYTSRAMLDFTRGPLFLDLRGRPPQDLLRALHHTINNNTNVSACVLINKAPPAINLSDCWLLRFVGLTKHGAKCAFRLGTRNIHFSTMEAWLRSELSQSNLLAGSLRDDLLDRIRAVLLASGKEAGVPIDQTASQGQRPEHCDERPATSSGTMASGKRRMGSPTPPQDVKRSKELEPAAVPAAAAQDHRAHAGESGLRPAPPPLATSVRLDAQSHEQRFARLTGFAADSLVTEMYLREADGDVEAAVRAAVQGASGYTAAAAAAPILRPPPAPPLAPPLAPPAAPPPAPLRPETVE